jgi:hypothetical protein
MEADHAGHSTPQLPCISFSISLFLSTLQNHQQVDSKFDPISPLSTLSLCTHDHMCVHAFGTMWAREIWERRSGQMVWVVIPLWPRSKPNADKPWSLTPPAHPSCPSPIDLDHLSRTISPVVTRMRTVALSFPSATCARDVSMSSMLASPPYTP